MNSLVIMAAKGGLGRTALTRLPARRFDCVKQQSLLIRDLAKPPRCAAMRVFLAWHPSRALSAHHAPHTYPIGALASAKTQRQSRPASIGSPIGWTSSRAAPGLFNARRRCAERAYGIEVGRPIARRSPVWALCLGASVLGRPKRQSTREPTRRCGEDRFKWIDSAQGLQFYDPRARRVETNAGCGRWTASKARVLDGAPVEIEVSRRGAIANAATESSRFAIEHQYKCLGAPRGGQ